MPQTYREYPIVEVAISVFSAPDDGGGERKKEGDIIAVRRVLGLAGTKERTDLLWLRLHGLDWNDYAEWTRPIDGADKRRFCIPLERLKQCWPNLDLVRTRQINDAYQPGVVVDSESGEFLIPIQPLNPVGLVYDKQLRHYL